MYTFCPKLRFMCVLYMHDCYAILDHLSLFVTFSIFLLFIDEQLNEFQNSLTINGKINIFYIGYIGIEIRHRSSGKITDENQIKRKRNNENCIFFLPHECIEQYLCHTFTLSLSFFSMILSFHFISFHIHIFMEFNLYTCWLTAGWFYMILHRQTKTINKSTVEYTENALAGTDWLLN